MHISYKLLWNTLIERNMRKEDLRQEHPAQYCSLILTGKLWTYLANLNEQAEEQLGLIIEQMKVAEGVIKELKA